MEGYEKYASRIQELLFDGMDVHEVWVYMKVMFQIEKNEICFRAYLERSGLIWFAEAGSRRQVPEEEKTYHPEERNVYDGYIDRVGMWKFCDDGGSVYACDKEFGTDKEIVYDVVTAWMPKEQIEPYKEK